MNSNCQAVGKIWGELEEKDTATVDVLASRNGLADIITKPQTGDDEAAASNKPNFYLCLGPTKFSPGNPGSQRLDS